jgi:hypothetical protein
LFWLSYLLLFIPQILFDVVAFDVASWLWFPIWTTAHLAATAFVMLVKLFGFDRFQAKHPSVIANLVVASLAGVIRVVWVGEFSYIQGLVLEFDLQARIAAGAELGL